MEALMRKYLINVEDHIPTLEKFLSKYPIVVNTDLSIWPTIKEKYCVVSELLLKEDTIFNPSYITSFEKYEINGETFYAAISFETPDENNHQYYNVYSYFKLTNTGVKNVFRNLTTYEILEHLPNQIQEYYLYNKASTIRDMIFYVSNTQNTLVELQPVKRYSIKDNILEYLFIPTNELIDIFREDFEERVEMTTEEFTALSYPDKIKAVVNILWNNKALPSELFNLMFEGN